jgi:hypothetical protein
MLHTLISRKGNLLCLSFYFPAPCVEVIPVRQGLHATALGVLAPLSELGHTVYVRVSVRDDARVSNVRAFQNAYHKPLWSVVCI